MNKLHSISTPQNYKKLYLSKPGKGGNMTGSVEKYLKSYLCRIPDIDEKVVNELIDVLHPYITNRVDIIKVDKWCRENNVVYKSKPILFVKTTFLNELKKGTFNISEKHCNVNYLFSVFEANGIEIKPDADVYLYTMYDFLHNEGYLNEKEIVECNKRAINALSNQGKTTDDVIAMFKGSKVSRQRNIDWEAIEKEVKRNLKTWEELKSLNVIDTIKHIKQYGQH